MRVATGLNVDVYFNLHRFQWSIRNRRSGLVEYHGYRALIADAKFVVGKAGRERVRREGRKNVHAYVRGRLLLLCLDPISTAPLEWAANRGIAFDNSVRVTYNPYRHETFVRREDETPVASASHVILDYRAGSALVLATGAA